MTHHLILAAALIALAAPAWGMPSAPATFTPNAHRKTLCNFRAPGNYIALCDDFGTSFCVIGDHTHCVMEYVAKPRPHVILHVPLDIEVGP